MRIAISSGVALTGDIGSPRRREFTVLGDVVNTAARIEDEVAGPGEIVISGATYVAVKDAIMRPAAWIPHPAGARGARSNFLPSRTSRRVRIDKAGRAA